MFVEALDGLLGDIVAKLLPTLAFAFEHPHRLNASINADHVVAMHGHLSITFPSEFVDGNDKRSLRIHVFCGQQFPKVP